MVVRLLLDHGADPNVHLDTDDHDAFRGFACGTTPVLLAAAGTSLEILELLHRGGANINATDRSGRTTETIATRHERADVVRWIRAHGM